MMMQKLSIAMLTGAAGLVLMSGSAQASPNLAACLSYPTLLHKHEGLVRVAAAAAGSMDLFRKCFSVFGKRPGFAREERTGLVLFAGFKNQSLAFPLDRRRNLVAFAIA